MWPQSRTLKNAVVDEIVFFFIKSVFPNHVAWIHCETEISEVSIIHAVVIHKLSLFRKQISKQLNDCLNK